MDINIMIEIAKKNGFTIERNECNMEVKQMIIDRDLSEMIIRRYGASIQDVILIEELSELQKEITKYMRGKGNVSHMAEEIAHCFISIAVVMLIHGISENDIQKEIDKKRKKIMKE